MFKVFLRIAAAVIIGLTALPLLAEDNTDYKGPVLYRYKNEQGIVVLNHTLPAHVAQNGYDVVTSKGRLIKSVEPALSDEEADRLEQERRESERLNNWDTELKRRYSSPADIEAQKQRKLDQIDTSILILQGNLRTLEKQLSDQKAKAADIERRGRALPDSIETNIKNLELEIEASNEQIAIRQGQFNETAAKYDKDIERFKVISRDKRS